MNSSSELLLKNKVRKKIPWHSIICGICLLVIICIFVLIGVGYHKHLNKTRVEISPDTHESFLIQNNKNEPEWVGKEVARRLGHYAKKTDTLINYMYKRRIPDAVIAQRLYNRWERVRKNPQGIRETGFGEHSAAYVVNKGEQLRICIRDPYSDNMFEDENTGYLVMLHELAHLMSKSFGHNQEFRKNFAFITQVAIDLGLYRYVDYSKHPTTYCSTDITHSPI